MKPMNMKVPEALPILPFIPRIIGMTAATIIAMFMVMVCVAVIVSTPSAAIQRSRKCGLRCSIGMRMVM